MSRLPSVKPLEWLVVDGLGLVVANQIVAVGRSELAAMRRLVAHTPLANLIDLTGGRKRRTVVILSSGQVILTPYTLQEMARQLQEMARQLQEMAGQLQEK